MAPPRGHRGANGPLERLLDAAQRTSLMPLRGLRAEAFPGACGPACGTFGTDAGPGAHTAPHTQLAARVLHEHSIRASDRLARSPEAELSTGLSTGGAELGAPLLRTGCTAETCRGTRTLRALKRREPQAPTRDHIGYASRWQRAEDRALRARASAHCSGGWYQALTGPSTGLRPMLGPG